MSNMTSPSSGNFIELNGKRYDVATGKLLNNPSGSLDVIAKTGAPRRHIPPKKAVPSRGVNHKPAHKPQSTKTLARRAVSKPTPAAKKLKAKTHPSASTPARRKHLLPAAAKSAINERRLAKAGQISRSAHITRFTKSAGSISHKIVAIGVQKPKSVPSNGSSAKKVAADRTEPSKLESILSSGLARANSHEQKAPATKKHRFGTKFWVITSAIAIALISGIGLLVHYLPTLEVQFAAARSGVHVQLPGYEPGGYSFAGPVQFSAGSVTISLQNAAQGHIDITAQNSSWDSETLKDNIVLPSDSAYSTSQASGRTIYVYGQGIATWVNGGIWYQISSNPALGKDQLIKLAASM